ncbi:MAG: polyphenol oxidase family protein [Polyangiales bacterium]
MTLRSAHLSELGFVHGFSTRQGGVSKSPFDSLNLGRAIGDSAESVAENHRIFAADVGYEALFELSQVHSATVREVRRAEDPKLVRAEEGDALIAREAGVAVGVRTADCIPLLLAHPPTGIVAAVHAGWRGVEAGIAAEAAREMAVPPGELLAVAGPHIRVASFEVGEDVAERLEAASSAQNVISHAYERPHVDLFRVLEAQLADIGVRLEDLGDDTFADAGRFFSYRRDGKTGRHLSVIVARGAA